MMTAADLRKLTVQQLVEKFVEAALGQFNAELNDETIKFNRLFDEIELI